MKLLRTFIRPGGSLSALSSQPTPSGVGGLQKGNHRPREDGPQDNGRDRITRCNSARVRLASFVPDVLVALASCMHRADLLALRRRARFTNLTVAVHEAGMAVSVGSAV